MYYKNIYRHGCKSFNKKFDQFLENNPDYGHDDDYIGTCEEDSYCRSDFDIEEELERACALGALEDDGLTKLGQLSPEEIYYLLVLYYDDQTANEYLEEIEYFEEEAVA